MSSEHLFEESIPFLHERVDAIQIRQEHLSRSTSETPLIAEIARLRHAMLDAVEIIESPAGDLVRALRLRSLAGEHLRKTVMR